LKHAHHQFDLDQPGKDSWRHRRAGAREVMVSSAQRWALVHELGAEAEPDLAALLARMSPANLVIVEGFKHDAFPKLEIFRAALGKPLMAPDDPHIVAIAADAPVAGTKLPQFALDDTAAIAAFIAGHCRLE
jgi:molybdopterin-guanine dinucleotide biosynthesis adapter protein